MSVGVDPSRCPLCGRGNACGMAAGKTSCWCAAVTIPKERLEGVPEDARGVACICEECARSAKTVDNRVVRLQEPQKTR